MSPYRVLNQYERYFLTITIMDWIDVFTRKTHKDVLIESLKFYQEEKALIIYAYVIMSNHIHLIAQAGGEEPLSNILRDFKKFTARTILKSIETSNKESRRKWMKQLFKSYGSIRKSRTTYQFWQDGSHPIEVYSQRVIRQKLNYIHLNPVKAGIVAKPEHYLYSSATNYVLGHGLLDIEIIE